MKELKSLGLSPKDEKDLHWWLENGLKEVHDYQENWKFITDTSEKFNEKDHGKVCVICGGKNYSSYNNHGHYCLKHYRQLVSHKRILDIHQRTPNEIKIYDGYCSIVTRDSRGLVNDEFLISDESVQKALISQWTRTTNGKGYCRSKKLGEVLHRYLFNINNKYNDIDHVNGNTHDNRLENLRECSRSQNTMNSKLSVKNSTGITGVTWYSRDECYRVGINIEGTNTHLGYFNSLEEATICRLNAEVKYYGKYAPQIHLYKEYNIDDSSVEYDPPYIRPCDMYLKTALEYYKKLI